MGLLLRGNDPVLVLVALGGVVVVVGRGGGLILVATRSQEGHMVSVVAGNCM